MKEKQQGIKKAKAEAKNLASANQHDQEGPGTDIDDGAGLQTANDDNSQDNNFDQDGSVNNDE